VDLISTYTRRDRNIFVDATRIAEGLFASHLAVNVFLLGVAYQGGLIPLSAASIEEAIRLNRIEAERNIQAFLWGRRYYQDARVVEEMIAPAAPPQQRSGAVERRHAELTLYQDLGYAETYRAFADEIAKREPALAEPVARYLFKLMAYKDEYEVARLLTRDDFEGQVREMWEEVETVAYNLHPPLLRALGWKKKISLGPWFRMPLRVLARMKRLRGTPFDIFGYASIRREERALILWYRHLIRRVLEHVTEENLPMALEIASLPDQIRGYESIKMSSVRAVKKLAEEKLAALKGEQQLITSIR
jgi:indolepyruvate ferredoxin oxidoreductase